MSDTEHLGMLRQRLKDSNPDLFACLERSWAVAHEWWLHAIDVSLGSSNSAPHLRNVERHLDETIKAFENLQGTAYTEHLAPAEIYVLLSGVLFHDIGRAARQPKTTPDIELPHGVLGERFLKEQYAHLGIPSVELAAVLRQMCVFHNPLEGTSFSASLRELHSTSIEPYGRIRVPFLAALLLLADCMDAAYTRALPEFLAPKDDVEVVGRFRRGIRGVYVDPAARMIRTVLVPNKEEKLSASSRYVVKLADKWISDWTPIGDIPKELAEFLFKGEKPEDAVSMLKEDVEKKLEKRKKQRESARSKASTESVGESQEEASPRPDLWKFYGEVVTNGRTSATSLVAEPRKKKESRILGFLLATGLGQLNRLDQGKQSDTRKDYAYPAYGDVAIALGDTTANRQVLEEIKDVLAAEGIVLAGWVVEREACLYNAIGELTYEPILTPEFLRRTIKGMWSLSTAVFGTSSFSYRDLAACIGEPDERRVEYAVRRIAATDTTPGKMSWIVASGGSWEWCVRRGNKDKSSCVLTGVKILLEEVDKVLHDPNEEFDQWLEWHKRMEEDSHAR